MPTKRSNLVKPFVQVAFLSLGLLCALSRIFDYWHHWGDVLVGLFLGTIVAFFIVSYLSKCVHQVVIGRFRGGAMAPPFVGFVLFFKVCITVGGEMYQLMTKSHLRDGTEPAVFFPEVAMQHDVFSRAVAFGVLMIAHTSSETL